MHTEPSSRRVLVVDDHPLYGQAILDALGRAAPALDGQAVDSAQRARELAGVCRFALVVADHRLPDGDGLDLLQDWPDTSAARVLISGADEGQLAHRARRAGLRGFLSKSLAPPRMIDQLLRVLEGGSCFDGPQTLEATLTERQIEVLQRAARGQSNRDIGLALGITERTVKDHMTLIFQRLGVASRAQAVARAGALGLIRLDREAR